MSASSLGAAFWWHHPVQDRTAEGLAEATVASVRRFLPDLVKVSPGGSYQVADLGLLDVWSGARRGYGAVLDRPVRTVADWALVERLGADDPGLLLALQSVERLKRLIEPGLPVVQTVFSPVAQAVMLAGEAGLARMLAEAPELVHRGLLHLRERTVGLLRRIAAAGGDGVFYAIQQLGRCGLPAGLRWQLHLAYDTPCLAALALMPQSVVHLHGRELALPASLPEGCWLHWEPGRGNPDLAGACAYHPGRIAVGLSPERLTGLAVAGEIESCLGELKSQAGARPLLVTPNCTLPLDLQPWVVERWTTAVQKFGQRPRLLTRPAVPPVERPAGGAGTAAVVAQVWRDTLGPERPTAWTAVAGEAALLLFLRLEQALGRRLPLELSAQAMRPEDIARWAERTLPLDRGRGDVGEGRPHLALLLPRAMPSLHRAALVRMLEAEAAVRVLELPMPPLHAGPAEAAAALLAGLAAQLPVAKAPALLGYGSGCRLAVALAAWLNLRGRPLRALALVDGVPGPEPAAGPSGRMARWWQGWCRAAIRRRRSGLMTGVMAAAGRLDPVLAELLAEVAAGEVALAGIAALPGEAYASPTRLFCPVSTREAVERSWSLLLGEIASEPLPAELPAALLPPHLPVTAARLRSVLNEGVVLDGRRRAG